MKFSTRKIFHMIDLTNSFHCLVFKTILEIYIDILRNINLFSLLKETNDKRKLYNEETHHVDNNL